MSFKIPERFKKAIAGIIKIIINESFWIAISAIATAIMAILTYIIIKQDNSFFDEQRKQDWGVNRAYVNMVQSEVNLRCQDECMYSFMLLNYGKTPARNTKFTVLTKHGSNINTLVDWIPVGILMPNQSHLEQSLKLPGLIQKLVTTLEQKIILRVEYTTINDECINYEFNLNIEAKKMNEQSNVFPTSHHFESIEERNCSSGE